MRRLTAALIVVAAAAIVLLGVMVLETTQAQAVAPPGGPEPEPTNWSRFLMGRETTSMATTDWNRFLVKPAAKGTPKIPTFHAAVTDALASMDLSAAELALWVRQLPETALRYLPNWSQARQEQVGLLARYIRSQNDSVDALSAWRQAAAFVHYSRKYGVPVDLAVAVANTESHFNSEARSRYGAMGVMQVVWRVHQRLLQVNGILSPDELHDPEKGIAAGCLLLGRYLRAYGDRDKALGRYYGGSAAVYAKRINTRLANLRNYAASMAATL